MAQDVLALFGAHNLYNFYEYGRITETPKKIFIHDDWNHLRESYDADISLLEFDERKIQYSAYIQPICLWDFENQPIETKGIVTAWGTSEQPGKDHEKLPSSNAASIQTNEQCFLEIKTLAGYSSTRTFCASFGNDSRVCSGDSGGGFFIKTYGVYHLKGIASSSLTVDGGCDVSRNAIYTNVTKFRDWIEKIAGNTIDSAEQDARSIFCIFKVKDSLIPGHPNTCHVDRNIDSEEFFVASPIINEIEEFELKDNGDVKYLPSRIGEKFPNLKKMSISRTGLTIVRDHYCKNMQNVELFHLSHNKIVTIEASAFRDMLNLKYLFAQENLIETLPESLFETTVKLKRELLKNNKIKFLSPSTFKIPNGQLETVALWSNVCIDKWYGPNPWDEEVYGMENLSQLESDLRTYCGQ